MATSRKPAAKKSITFKLAILGQEAKSKSAKHGVTVGHLRSKYTLEGLNIKVNGVSKGDSYILESGDEVLVVTQVKSGS